MLCKRDICYIHSPHSVHLLLSPKQEDTDGADVQLTHNQKQLGAPQTLHLQQDATRTL